MGPKKGRRVRKIDVPTEIPTEFELGIQLLIYRGAERRWGQDKGKEEAQK